MADGFSQVPASAARKTQHRRHGPCVPSSSLPMSYPPAFYPCTAATQSQNISPASHAKRIVNNIQATTLPFASFFTPKTQSDALPRATAPPPRKQALIRNPSSGTPAAPRSLRPSAFNHKEERDIVTDYLLKRGFTKTEHVFRQESKHLGPDGRPHHDKVLDLGPKRYLRAFNLLKTWVEKNLDIYKFELSKLLWPTFVYSWMELVKAGYNDDAQYLLSQLKPNFEPVHGDDLKLFATVTQPQYFKENNTLKLYAENKYRVPLSQHIIGDFFHFLERENDQGGAVIRQILQSYCQLDSIERGPVDTFSFEAIYRRSQNLDLEEPDIHEGIPGVFTGLSNRDILDPKTPLKLGPLPMEPDFRDDLRAELMDEDQRNPPAPGLPTLTEEFEAKIKHEESDDAPNRNDLPLPPSRPRDVVIEMQKVRENRDRFRIEGRTGGVGGIPVSACMFTFHNTLGSVSCMDFSKDHQLVAAGTQDSYIRVWSLDGKPLSSKHHQDKDLKINNRKLIGHSGPVYDVSFSDAISTAEPGSISTKPFGDESKDTPTVQSNARLLLSCSADGTIRLWSLELWQCLCLYKGHEGPVFRAQWSPHGHYFLSGGWDKTARVWMQDHATCQRFLVGHDTSISAVTWHPNGTYVFTASDETDKSIRMWSVITGNCVRVFTGHTDYISALDCAPSGKMLASADNSGSIIFWDIEKGTRIKRSRGHGKGGIWSLSFSAESNVLISGGQDGTVRLWDVALPADGHKAAAVAAAAAAALGQQPNEGSTEPSSGAASTETARPVAGSTAPSGKKKGKEVMITPDQISAFPTKKTPVMKVSFSRMNLVIAGGCFDPDR